MTLRFHWRLLHGGETKGDTRVTGATLGRSGLPDPPSQTMFCRRAEQLGIDGLLTDFGASKPDSIVLATALG